MSLLLSLEKVSLAYGLHPLLDQVKLQISSGERVCLIGRNGAGKSSLLKILDGSIAPDAGNVWRKPALRIGRLTQELPSDLNLTVFAYVAGGLAAHSDLINAYHHCLAKVSDGDAAALDKLAQLQKQIDAVDGWQFENRIQSILSRLKLPAETLLKNLSGGWQRRAVLAKALVVEPELLLLDEPTNHLDIAAIEWLEEQLLTLSIGIVFITHDRALLQRLATRIIELDRGQLTSWPGDYANFLRRKAELLHAESQQNAEFDKKLAQEEVWIRQGIKARRTRNEGRVRALQAMRRERSQRIEQQKKASFNINSGDNSGQLVVEAEQINYAYADSPLVKDFSLRIMRGDRIGLVGPNGIGKSTLINLLLGNLSPQTGSIKLGTQLQIAYFDQLRAKLDLEKTVIENVVEGSDTLTVNGKSKHVISYLGDFLFTPERARTPAKALSGGECNRLLLAKLFTQPANLLILDEPTNDLDIETLELLEELLTNFTGTLLIVSHDRAFLDNIVTSLLIFSGEGKITEFVGGYSSWVEYQQQQVATQATSRPKTNNVIAKNTSSARKLSYKEQRELSELPTKIEQLETEINKLQLKISAPEFYQQAADLIATTMQNLEQQTTLLSDYYSRWETLEALQQDLLK